MTNLCTKCVHFLCSLALFGGNLSNLVGMIGALLKDPTFSGCPIRLDIFYSTLSALTLVPSFAFSLPKLAAMIVQHYGIDYPLFSDLYFFVIRMIIIVASVIGVIQMIAMQAKCDFNDGSDTIISFWIMSGALIVLGGVYVLAFIKDYQSNNQVHLRATKKAYKEALKRTSEYWKLLKHTRMSKLEKLAGMLHMYQRHPEFMLTEYSEVEYSVYSEIMSHRITARESQYEFKDKKCAICDDDLKYHERIERIKPCGHSFHIRCRISRFHRVPGGCLTCLAPDHILQLKKALEERLSRKQDQTTSDVQNRIEIVQL